ncbi:hypothetical protein QT196_14110 [Streptomyces sp. P9-2B-2]|uniref:hypothetical protein n=1 Tax=Streptomyces sp. P9-2B-2 TaxID=3057114 RepID=UPI0025B3BDB8|nr:hypothetical protein [Streptomyces sp. P9-2B-2]WJY38332.1 hypothetical protein QT196_14110 [Streptomyces sp. P9-2B-2]
MSEHTIVGDTEQPEVSWDFGVGVLSIAADGPEPGSDCSPSVRINFSSRIWISLDRNGNPVSVDILDAPAIIARVVPPARRGDPGPGPATAAAGGIPWLLDTDSDWIWVELIRSPVSQRLERNGHVELRLTDDRPTQLKLRVPVTGTSSREPVAGAADRAGAALP